MRTAMRVVRSRRAVIAVAMGIGLYLACTTSDSTSPPDGDGTLQETPEMKALSDSLIAAFRAEDKEQVLSYVSEEYRPALSEDFTTTTASLPAFAAALENRTLVAGDDLFAEYSVTVDSVQFRVAYAQCGDGVWHLVGF